MIKVFSVKLPTNQRAIVAQGRMTRHTESANNFDLLRLVFAASVVLWHCHAVSMAETLKPLSLFFSADLGVKGFFVVSGFLVVKSYEQSSSLGSYVSKRARRIFPAYFAVVMLAFLVGAAFTPLSFSEYFLGGAGSYLIWNLVFLNFLAPTLPGIFASNPWIEVNGALWTLKIEVMFYAFVPILLASCRRLGSIPVLVALYALSVLYSVSLANLYETDGKLIWLQLQRQLPGQLTYFLIGAALFLYFNWARNNWFRLCAVGVASILVCWQFSDPIVRIILEPLAIGIGVVLIAYGLPYFGNFARFGDLSYGLYIIHFPLIQILVATGFFARSPWQGFFLSVALSLAMAFLCWRLIEKPFLSHRSHYRLAEAQPASVL